MASAAAGPMLFYLADVCAWLAALVTTCLLIFDHEGAWLEALFCQTALVATFWLHLRAAFASAWVQACLSSIAT